MRKYLLLLSCAVVSTSAMAQDRELTEEERIEQECQLVNPPCGYESPRRSADDFSKPIAVIDGIDLPIGPTTVTVTGTPIETEDTGQPVTIFSQAEIESVQGPDITRILRRAPGVAISRNGGVGSFTGVRVRGAESEQLLVLIDGVRVNDPSSPSGGFDFGNLLSGNVTQVELLRGSNSTVWGSDAVAGVLSVQTRADGGVDGSFEYGARESFSGNLSGSIETDDAWLSLAGGYYTSDGFSSAANGTEADGFEQFALTARGDVYLTYSTSIFASGRYAEGEVEIDGFPFPSFTLSDTPEYQETTQYSGAVGVRHDNGPLYLQAAYSFADTERANFNPTFGTAPGFVSDGHSDRIDVKGEYRLIGPLLVNFGADAEWTSLETNFTPLQETRILGGYVQAGIEFGGLSGHIGVRQDDHARFGGATSFGADVSYTIGDNLRVKASVGEGFKAPTLFQLFSDFGNDALVPEKSTSFDLGLAYGERSSPAYAAITVFRRDSEDLIQFVSCATSPLAICPIRPFGTYDNVARARAQGVEIEGGVTLAKALQVRAAYSYVDSEDRTTGNQLARRPKHAVNVAIDWDSAAGSGEVLRPRLGADIRMVSDAFDDAFNTVQLDGYVVVDLRAEQPVADIGKAPLTLFARVENLFDANYQTAAGYAQAGRGVFGGVRFDF